VLPIQNSNNSYVYLDEKVPTGNAYYKVKCVYLDGRVTYSNVILLNKLDKALINVYPNPAESYINVSFNKPTTDEVSISIIDNIGKVVSVQNTQVGVKVVKLNIASLASGVYNVSVKDNSVISNFQFVKQ
jgi:hypothetical protein